MRSARRIATSKRLTPAIAGHVADDRNQLVLRPVEGADLADRAPERAAGADADDERLARFQLPLDEGGADDGDPRNRVPSPARGRHLGTLQAKARPQAVGEFEARDERVVETELDEPFLHGQRHEALYALARQAEGCGDLVLRLAVDIGKPRRPSREVEPTGLISRRLVVPWSRHPSGPLASLQLAATCGAGQAPWGRDV